MLHGIVNGKKKAWHIPAVLAVTALLIAAGTLALFSGRTDAAAGGGGVSQQYAKKAYSLRVDDLTDTAAVATLLEAMDMETLAGKYSVEIAPESGVYTLLLVAEKSVKAENKASFDAKMGKKAQQLLALIPQLGKVEWTYSLRSGSTGGKQENQVNQEKQENQASESVDTASAGEALGRDVRDFGASQKAFGELLALQAESDE